MKALRVLAAAVALSTAVVALPLAFAAPSLLVGHWAIDRENSQFPAEVGFGMPVAADVQTSGNTQGRASGRQGSNPNRVNNSGVAIATESEQTIKILHDLTEEAKTPWPVVVIAQPDAATVTIDDGNGHVRTFHPGGKGDEAQLADGGIDTKSRWNKGSLEVDYLPEKDRIVRYTYTRATQGDPLTVGVAFLEKGKGDVMTRSYRESTGGG